LNCLIKFSEAVKKYGENKMTKKILQSLILMVLLVSTAFAQYGKMSGSVIDRETGEPLIGANVIIVGTTMGAATDINGHFVILNVPPGTHALKVTYVGYQEVTVSNIRVVAGLTAFVENIKTPSVAIETEPIFVVAERPLIEKSATNAIRITSSEDIENLPVRGAEAYFTLQPGVVLQNDRIHIRGSRSDEVGYVIEGASVKNIVDRDGGSIINTIPEALEEVLVQAGGYSAQFGGANAGIVQQNFKTGTRDYHATIQFETDNFGNYPGEKALGAFSYGYNDIVATISGPLLLKNVRFFLSGENRFIRDYTPTFWDGSPENWSGVDADGNPIPVDTLYDTGLRGGAPHWASADEPDFEVLSMHSGNIPSRFRNRYTFNGTLLFDLKKLQIRTASIYSFQQERNNELPIRNLFAQERLPLRDESEIMINTKLNYFFNPKTFLEVNVNFLDDRSKTYDPYFKDDVLLYSDSLAAAQYGWTYRSYSGQPKDYDFYGFPFRRPGRQMTNFYKSQREYWGGGAALTSQIGKHELRLGGELTNWTVRNYSLGRLGSLLGYIRLSPDDVRDADELATIIRVQSKPNIYGFDEFGNVIEEGKDGPKNPSFRAAYIQDKIQFDDLIINAGLRYDYIFMDDWEFVDPLEPDFDLDEFTIPDTTQDGEENFRKSKAHEYLSPRIGFSFPVTDKTVFHLQYGKFVQPPGLDVAYRGLAYSAFIFSGGYYFTNPIGYDLEPERSTQYEVGFSQQFTDFAAFDVTAFYKDIKGQIQYDLIDTAPGYRIGQYPVYSNKDYAITKGFEFQLRIRRINRIMGQINYTISSARGTNSFTQSAGGAIEGPGQLAPKITVPLDFDQTHRGSVNLDYRFGRGDGGPILEQSGLNILFTFNSGHRYTLAESPGGLGQEDAATGAILNNIDARQRAPLEAINSSTTPWVFNIDMRLDKTIDIAGVGVNFYLYVQNLLNRQNVINVYYATGNAYTDGFLNSEAAQSIIDTYGEQFADLYQWANLENRQHNWWMNDWDLFFKPMQVRFGINVEI